MREKVEARSDLVIKPRREEPQKLDCKVVGWQVFYKTVPVGPEFKKLRKAKEYAAIHYRFSGEWREPLGYFHWVYAIP